MQKTYTFHVDGLHCQSCILLTQNELKEMPQITNVQTSLKTNSIQVTGDFGDKSEAELLPELSEILKPLGYTLSLNPTIKPVSWSDFAIAIPVALTFIFGFILLQKLGIVNLVNTSEVTYGTAFFVGLIASVSTCMAVVGGLVLSLSANFAKEGDKTKPQILFHLGRLISFFVFGGVIGMLGSFVQFNQTTSLVLGVFVALVLLVLGINLLDVFPWVKRLQLFMPSSLSNKANTLKKTNHTLTPFLVGAATFILPCGFTQSMQFYTLTTGSFFKGGLTMFAFALGTLPVLALLSFSSLGIHNKGQSSIFFKTVGLVVIFFAIFNLLSALVGAGIIDPFFTL